MSAGCDVIFIRNPKYRFGSSFDRVSDFNLDPTVQFTTVNVVNCKSGNYNCTIYAVLYNILVMVVVMKSIDIFGQSAWSEFYILNTPNISTATTTEDQANCWMDRDDDVEFNCPSNAGSVAGTLVVFCNVGSGLQNTIPDGAVAGGDTVPLVTLPTFNGGVGINVGNAGSDALRGTDGTAVGATVDVKLGVAVDGGKVEVGVVGTSKPTATA